MNLFFKLVTIFAESTFLGNLLKEEVLVLILNKINSTSKQPPEG